MLEKFLRRPCTLAHFRASPAGAHIDPYSAALCEEGYKRKTVAAFVRDAVHLGRWAAGSGIPIEALDEQAIDGFRSHLAACHCAHVGRGGHGRSAGRACVFLDYLRKAGVAAGAVTTAGPPQPAVVDEFADWLRQHRGTAAATVRAYKRWIYGLVERLGEDPTVYTPQALRAAVVAMAAGHSTSTADQVVKATRMFLRFLAVDGRCSLYLVDGILPIAPRNQARLPSYLTREEMDKLVSHCDPATPAGLRDRAILLLLVRLGLRADDVRGLRLQDIDWTDASFCVTGKGRRETRLPLSQEVGDAILAYLEHGRPRVGFEQVFLTVQPPWRPMAGTVGDIVRRTLRRSGIETRPRGSHLLRHSAATAMLHEGASLPAIGAVLRHRSIETTTQYTRVDARLLRQVAQPWPEVAPC